MIGHRRVRIDRADGSAKVERLDGGVLAWRTRTVKDAVASADIDLVARRCVLERADGGPAITVDFPVTVFARPPGPIVYLNQNRWINVTRAVLTPEQVTPESERESAKALADAAHRRELTLPLAAAHVVELSHAGSARRRRELGHVMADLSNGWFMRSPLAVRREEIMTALRTRACRPTEAGPRPSVFTAARLPSSPPSRRLPTLNQMPTSAVTLTTVSTAQRRCPGSIPCCAGLDDHRRAPAGYRGGPVSGGRLGRRAR